MNSLHVEFELPTILATQAELDVDNINQEVRRMLALFLYEHRRISLSKACELGAMSLWEFADMNHRLGIPIHYSAKDLGEDYEVVVLGAGRYGAREVEDAEWIKTQEVENHLAVQAFRLTLGAGESEAMVLAQECAADFIILDDWKARQMALGLSLPVIGTVAVLTKATESRVASELASATNNLTRALVSA